MRRRGSRQGITRTEWVAAALGAAQTAQTVYSKVREVYAAHDSKRTFVVTVSEYEPIWWDVQDRLLRLIPPDEQRSLMVIYNRSTKADPVSVAYQGKATHTVSIGGHRVNVTVLDGPGSGKKASGGGDTPEMDSDSARKYGRSARTAQFDCTSTAARDAVIAWLSECAMSRRNREHPPTTHIVNRWGNWDEFDDVHPRDPNTVILPDGAMDSLIGDIEQFLDSRAAYERIGIPWHRGVLLWGPPGCGKSSLARALATKFNLDLWYIPLGDLSSDADLLGLVARIRTGGILLLEDVDVFNAATERTESGGEAASLAGLLNALDGIATPPGLVTIMTTNQVDRLDTALTRPGRADVKLHVNYLNDDQVSGLFELAYDRRPESPLPSVTRLEVSAADVLECFKRHLSDPVAGEKALVDALNAKTPASTR